VLIIIGACIFFYKKKKKQNLTPYQIWTNHYSNKKSSKNVEEDIHHFYRKDNYPVAPQNPGFSPHISTRLSINSQMIKPKLARASINRPQQMHPM
jgi:hypothetical protein